MTESQTPEGSSSDRILTYLYEHPETIVSLDTETDGLRVDDGRNVCIGISIAFLVESTGKMAKIYWGFNHRRGQNVDEKTRKKIAYVLQKQRRPIIFANAQFDILSCLTVGIDLRENPFWDVLTMMNMVQEEWTIGRRGLDELAAYLGCSSKIHEWEYAKFDEKVRRRKTGTDPDTGKGIYESVTVRVPRERTTLKWQKENGWPHTTPEMLHEYAAQDAVVTYNVWATIVSMKEWADLPRDAWQRKSETILTLMEMRLRGVLVDQELVGQLIEEGEQAKAKVIEMLGGLNPKSNPDLRELLIERLGLPILKVSEKTGAPSFDKSVMPEYDEMLSRDGRDEAKFIKIYRGWDTAVGLLLVKFRDLVSPDGRLRTEYTTHQTVTGRLSSKNPNLQQISKDGGAPWNDRILKCLIPKPGFVHLSADYSQLELRIGTAYSQEPELLKIFEEGRDIFTEMTAQIKEQLSKTSPRIAEGWTRHKTKTLVYSIQYGGGVKRIMSAFGVSKKDAQTIISNFYRTYRRFRALSDLITERVESTGKARIWSGRYRHFKYRNDSYKGMNSVIQGGAADVVERVMVHAMKTLDNEDCRMLLQIHDALVFEVREELADEYAVKIKNLMEDVNGICAPDSEEPLFPVKFAVEVSVW